MGNRGSQGMWFNVEKKRHKEMLAQVKKDVLKVKTETELVQIRLT